LFPEQTHHPAQTAVSDVDLVAKATVPRRIANADRFASIVQTASYDKRRFRR
jgi:hypothetical protein